MYITRYNPFYEVRSFSPSIVDRVFGEQKEHKGADFRPLVSMRENDEAYFVDIDVPGVKKEDISIDVKDNVLTISGERSFKEEVKEEDFYKVETSYGSFSRSFTLPEKVDIDKIEARHEDGVLEVSIAKLPEVQTTKKITIN